GRDACLLFCRRLALACAARIDSIGLHRSCGLLVTNSPHLPTARIPATMIGTGRASRDADDARPAAALN
ncbi:MAG: hypothetical protein WA418_06110, partial [Bradyrhizobium sp.]